MHPTTRLQAPTPSLWIRALAPLALGIATALAACAPGDGDAAAVDEATASAVEVTAADAARAEVLIARLTPPPPERVEAQDPWVDDRRAVLAGMGDETEGVGVALERLVRTGDHDRATRRGALEAAALAAPRHVAPYLAELVDDYGEDLGLRETAARVLGRADPALAIEALEPHLRSRPRGTYPPTETILDGWLAAKRALGEDPVPVLALVATDIYMDEATRNRSIRELGADATPLAREALRELLIESTGNGYLRRLAAQSVAAAFAEAEACAILEEVAMREADPSMQVFLANLIDAHCP